MQAKEASASGRFLGCVSSKRIPYLRAKRNPQSGKTGDHRLHFEGATGFHTVWMLFENVFVPDEAITLARPRHGYSAVFSVVLPCALPLIMSVYLGIAEAAAKIAVTQAAKRVGDEVAPYLIGEMLNQLTTAQVTVSDMLAIADDLNFVASIETTDAMLMRKTIAVNAVINSVEKAMETAGGAGYFRRLGLERMLRDIRAAQFHPMQEKRQHRFSGRVALNLEPIGLWILTDPSWHTDVVGGRLHHQSLSDIINPWLRLG